MCSEITPRSAFSPEIISEKLGNQIELGSSLERAAVEITGACGGKCSHCYAIDLKRLPQMGEVEFKATIDGVKKAGFKEVYIVGGEPMLHKQVVEFCRYAREQDLVTDLVTNGYKLNNPEIAEEVLRVTDQVEISLRSLHPAVHDNVVLGQGWVNEKPEKPPKVGSFKEAVEALEILNQARERTGGKTKLAVNFDLYKQVESFEGHGMSYAIAKMLIQKGITLNGFYAQLVSYSGRAKEKKGDIRENIQIDKNGLLQALSDLKAMRDELGIKDVGMTDNPVRCGIINSLDEIPEELRGLIIGEVVPAIAPNGSVRKNVVELTPDQLE